MNIIQKIGLGLFVIAIGTFISTLFLGTFTLDKPTTLAAFNEYQQPFVEQHFDEMSGAYSNVFSFVSAFDKMMGSANESIKKDLAAQGITTSDGDYWSKIIQDYQVKTAKFSVTKASSGGVVRSQSGLLFFLSFILGIIGALVYIFPKASENAGIKHNGIYFSSMHNKGWLGIATGIYLIGFYVLLYFFPHYIVNWVILLDPISTALNGGPASQWFLYGFLYTICMLVMGIRMIVKYRHNNYQIVRTISVVFFQTAFAFLIPEILASLNQPAHDLKNIWPLDYSFFFDYRLDKMMESGTIGIFMLFWGILLIIVGVPLFTFFFGKRWYCSWVCGCGGLAETLGDPYRHLSDKSKKAWQVERWVIHTVMVFAAVMTGAVLYNYFTGSSQVLFLDSYKLRSSYGFLIGSVFAGVVGTGFYPLMGNRVWCRFGCPLAGYFGLIQRWRSRFRITTNGGQCISCGNCSTYCEMGIDVRSYAQRGQDIVRASCVGCGVCAAVCPRGVLRLENAAEDVNTRTQELRAIHITADGISIPDLMEAEYQR